MHLISLVRNLFSQKWCTAREGSPDDERPRPEGGACRPPIEAGYCGKLVSQTLQSAQLVHRHDRWGTAALMSLLQCSTISWNCSCAADALAAFDPAVEVSCAPLISQVLPRTFARSYPTVWCPRGKDPGHIALPRQSCACPDPFLCGSKASCVDLRCATCISRYAYRYV